MKVLFYSQHILGIGHFFRSMEIARALGPNEVLFIEGGEPLHDFIPPPHVRRVFLPPVMMDPTFSEIQVGEGVEEDIWRQRGEILMEAFDHFKPHRIVTELFPFGRRLFRHELMPLLEAARKDPLHPRVVCSLRDILVEKADREKYERRVLDILNTHYDLLLVHADPRIIDLAETFSRTEAVAIPIMYTGFVCRPAPPRRKPDGQQVIVASTGGGGVGTDLLQTTIRAFRSMPGERLELRVFVGPFMEDADRAALMSSASGDSRISLRKFSNNFPEELAVADLSISMAGYNTCMDILASKVPALVYPFAQNREQALRASRLESLGLLRTLTDLSKASLLEAMEALLLHPSIPAPNGVDLNGAEKTARILTELWPET